MVAGLEDFGHEVRQWLAENCPQSMRKPIEDDSDIYWGGRQASFKSDDQRDWFERMAARGWTVPAWSKEYGGGGLGKEEAKVLQQEMRRIKARIPLQSFGIWMLGPALLRYGNEAQKKEHLTKIARGEIRWCQGYSEPNAGSDLASLQTRAEDKGDHFLVNGSKIWTSYADKSDWIFCLVRTDPKAPKHNGISFVLFDLASAGVSTKPIKLISGYSPFCEIFFENVQVPKENLVGEINLGWGIAKFLLTHEREMIGGLGIAQAGSKKLSAIAIEEIGLEHGRLRHSNLRTQLAWQDIDAWSFLLTMERAKDESESRQGIGAVSSLLKYYGTELEKRRHELLMSIMGMEALGWEGEEFDDGEIARSWLRSKGRSIEGGTSEIQLNIIAKRILGLPS